MVGWWSCLWIPHVFDKPCQSFQRFDQVHVDLWSWHCRQWCFLHELVHLRSGCPCSLACASCCRVCARTWAGPFAELAGRATAPEVTPPPLCRGQGAIRPLSSTCESFCNPITFPHSRLLFLLEEVARVASRTLPLWLALTSQCLPSPGLLVVFVQAAVRDFFPSCSQLETS